MHDLQKKLYKKFEEMGEEAVRDALAGRLFDQIKTHYANRWLEALERSRADTDRNREASVSEAQIDIARSAKNAAWIAATIAIVAMLITIYVVFIKPSS